MSNSLPLSQAKARFSEIIRTVRQSKERIVVTVDGEPAAAIAPLECAPRDLTPEEIATHRALMNALGRIPRPADPFDAVALIREGRR